ncbi:hypothetical protein F4781DRAFT_406048 [Annulohypoxylon bovei var. microspora]|nr:hypothetical protein F4781DRAFT_406048 [Annulohypoxylon bovei var. microspora]
MAELYRVTQGAIRSTSILRNSASRWPSCSFFITPAYQLSGIRQLSTTPILRSIEAGSGRLPTSNTQRPNYSSDTWISREPRPVVEIKKPDISAYDEDDVFAPEIDFETGELTKNAPEERSSLVRPPMRLVPRTGRTIRVGKTVDVARSFMLLNIQVSQNQIRQDFHHQKFHERPGLKRKRLKSERWRKRFRKGFKACIVRVKELTRQGW